MDRKTSMRHDSKTPFLSRLAVGMAAVAAGSATPATAQILPPRPDPTCVVSNQEFTSWFDTRPGLNQPVKAANSIGLNTSNNCNFYKWSEQMFLWLTSPATGPYQGNRVLDSQVFYQIDNNGNLVPQSSSVQPKLALRAAKSGPDGLPVVVNAKGHVREFVTAPSDAGLTKLRAIGGEGPSEIASIKPGEGGKAVFLDANGKTTSTAAPKVTADMLPQTLGRLTNLVSPTGARALGATPSRPRIAEALNAKKVLIAFNTKSGQVFVEAGTGIVDFLGPGQAGGNGVLVSQSNALVFYDALVNDVYAWYVTGRNAPNGIPPQFSPTNPATNGLFPTSATELRAILAFSSSHGGPSSFPDSQALTVETKLSWVDSATLPDRGQSYITALAFVPTYNTSNSTDWSPTVPRLAKLALVGAHIVGSANGHPEMIWATFEHQKNTPLATYAYNSGGKPVTVQQNTSGTWLFSASGATGPYNPELGVLCPNGTSQCSASQSGHIIANTPPAAIGPGNDLRQKPWGVASDGIPNQEDKTSAAANTQIVSLGTDVRAKLSAAGAAADPRSNYVLIGATWTLGGGQPNGAYPTAPGTADEIGTSMLANSTMETFFQGADTTFNSGLNCFGCHTAAGANPQVKADTSVSHLFSFITPQGVLKTTKAR